MNKELFVSSTPHETKVGLVEDDQLAEVYLERENEYTLAGSIYKGRVTRVLPGMQSAFVDIGLERDAFLYVSDFLDLEDHDEDMTEVVPANRPPQRQSSAPEDAQPGHERSASGDESFAQDEVENALPVVDGNSDAAEARPADRSRHEGSSSERGARGGRRRRGGRRDGRETRDTGREPGRESTREASHDSGRDSSRDSSRDSGRESTRESRVSRPSPVPTAPEAEQPPSRSFGPPAGYQPMLLPGESLSKYKNKPQFVAPANAGDASLRSSVHDSDEPSFSGPAAHADDEPIFAAAAAAPAHHEPVPETKELDRSEASTSSRWVAEYRKPEPPVDEPILAGETRQRHSHDFLTTDEAAELQQEIHKIHQQSAAESVSPPAPVHDQHHLHHENHEDTVEDTVEEHEAVTAHADAGVVEDDFEEFEEETQAADGAHYEAADHLEVGNGLHGTATTDAAASLQPPVDDAEDDEEFELEEAQAEAEALLAAEAQGGETGEAGAELRTASGTPGEIQRAPRPAHERRGGQRGGARRPAGGRRFSRRDNQDVPKISDLLKEGQEILVQIAKEPIGKKGARITSHIALPGRFLVYMPTVNHTGVSRKIASDEERQRLKRIVMSERDNDTGGFIVRTAAQRATEDELRADIRFLKGLWNDIKTRSDAGKPPALIYHDLNVVERVLRDLVTSEFSSIWVDTEPEYERILRFFTRFQPGLVKRVKLYTKETPLFEQFGLAEEMNKALKSKVWLKSGGYIVINQTEALVAIDINTGKYVGKTTRLEDTIVKTNVDAIKEIVRQIRLRDLGGIIVIDFIDMDERRNRQRVMQALEEELRLDRAPSKALQFNDFGLVAITRKRVKQSLERTIGAPCPYCQSTGYVKSVTTVCNEIYVEMRKISKHLEHQDVMLRVNPDVAKELKNNNAHLLNEMEELTKRTIIVKSDPAVHQEQFDIN